MKIILLFFLVAGSFFAQEVSTRYDVHVTMLGHVGYCDVFLHEDARNYEIKAIAKTIDVAAFLLKDRVETFVSRGKIRNGRYIPDIFIKTKKTTKRTRVQTYSFDHDKKEVTLVEEKIKIVNKLMFDSDTFEFVSKEVEEKSRKEELLDHFIADDTLSIYLNSRYGCASEQKKHKIVAIGAHNDENNVSYECLEGAKKNVAITQFGNGIQNAYNLHVEPLDEDDEIVDVLLAYDENGFLQGGLMDEIFWVGSIRAVRVSHKILND